MNNHFKKLLWILPFAGFLSATAVFSCGWNEPEYFYHSKSLDILYGELVKQHFDRRRSFFPGSYSSDEYDEAQLTETYNLQAWGNYLKVTLDEARAIVYERVPEKLAAQPDAVKAYLGIVSRQEPVANSGDLAWLSKEEQRQKKAENDQLGKEIIAEIRQQLDTEKDAFLRQRYAYLLVRLQHYTGHYQEALSDHEQYATTIQQPDKEVAAWTDMLYAGGLQRSGKRAEAAYRFASIFPQTATKKLQAQLNFSIKTDDEWNALMALCKSDDEKALMHFVRALRVNANSLEELKTVYALAPDSEWFDALLFRELESVQFADTVPGNTAEPWLQASRSINREVLIDDLNAYAEAKTEQEREKLRTRRSQYLTQLSQLVAQVRNDKKRQDLFLADYAALYLKLLAGQSLAVAELKEFEAAYPGDSRLPYTRPLEHFAYLENLGTLDASVESVVADDITAVEALEKTTGENDDEYSNDYKRRTQDVITYTYAKLEPLYAAVKQAGKAYLAKKRGDVELDEITVGEIRDLLALQDKASPNRWEQVMEADFRDAFGYVDYETRKFVESHDTNELIARKYLAAGSFDEAKAAAEGAQSKLFKTDYNPFTTGRSGNNRIKSRSRTLLEVIEVMQKLENEVRENPADAQTHFLLGTAYYNMTWFGNSPMLIRTSRSTSSWKQGMTDFNKAREHYELVLKHATDRELKAKTLYALAKIEENEFYIGQDKKGTNLSDYWPHGRVGKYTDAAKFAKDNGLGKYFEQIRDYEDTRYFKDVISQCADYKYYVGR